MLQVLWLTSWYPSDTTGSLGNFIQRQAESLSKYCAIAVLFATEKAAISDYQISHKVSQFSETIVYFPPTSFLPLKLFRYFRAWFMGYQYLKKQGFQPSLVQLNVVFPMGLFMLYLHFFEKLPYIIREHWTGYKPEDGELQAGFQKTITHYVVKYAQKIVTETDYNAFCMQQHGFEGDYQTLPNVVDTSLFAPRDTPKLPLFTFLHVSGLLDKHKNISGILAVIQKIAAQRTDFRCHFVGGTTETIHFFEKKAKDMGIEKFVTFLGTKTTPEVADLMPQYHAFLLFSNYEGLPCVVLEAMSAGLPIIATETGDMTQWVDEKVGYVLPIDDKAALLIAMQQMIDNKMGNDKNYIRQKIVDTCSYEVVATTFQKIYHSVLKNNPN